MSKRAVMVLDMAPGQLVGKQIRSILESAAEYRTELRVSPPPQSDEDVALVVAVVPEQRNDGDWLLARVARAYRGVPVLPVLSPHALVEDYDARLLPTRDVLVTPLRESEVLFRVGRLVLEPSRASMADDIAHSAALGQLVGDDREFVALKRRLQLAARSESTVLLTGETGTGKERCARALHYLGRRASGPFVPVNCGAIPLELFERELFGHVKGAFTGAAAAQPGFVAEAEGGTLFLDEVETLSLASQVKLLRFLQDKSYNPVGSARLREADVWFVAATNVDLATRVRDGAFRQDLFYRLAVINLRVPPLRERRSDVRSLAAHFWSLYAAKAGRTDDRLSEEVLRELEVYSWPGNVRELENVIQQLAVLTEAQVVRPEDLPIPRALAAAATTDTNSFARKKRRAVEEFERTYLTKLMNDHAGNVTHAAREAKKDRRALGRLIKKYRISRD